jgi:hypothetical protein
MAARHRTREGESGLTSRRKDGIAVPERQVSIALTRHDASSNIDNEQEIVAPVPDGPISSLLTVSESFTAR